jgi:hypothetical protein
VQVIVRIIIRKKERKQTSLKPNNLSRCIESVVAQSDAATFFLQALKAPLKVQSPGVDLLEQLILNCGPQGKASASGRLCPI